MKRWIAVAAMVLGLLPGSATRAGEVSESITNRNVAGPPGYVWDGTRWRRMTGSSAGATNTTNATPGFLQESAATVVSGDTLQIGEANFSAPLTATANLVTTASPYTLTGSFVWVRIKVTGITAGYPWSVRFYGSRDGSTYAPIMRSMQYWRTPAYGVGAVGGAGTADDTLKITRRAPTGANGNWFPLQADAALDLIARQIIAVCSNDSGSATIGTTATFTVEFAQRQR